MDTISSPSFTTHVDVSVVEMAPFTAQSQCTLMEDKPCTISLDRSPFRDSQIGESTFGSLSSSEHATHACRIRRTFPGRGSAITNRIALSARKVEMVGQRTPESEEVFCSFTSRRREGFTPKGEKEGKKMRWAHGRSCSTSCRGMSRRPPEIRSNQPSHIHPTQWKMNDMKTC